MLYVFVLHDYTNKITHLINPPLQKVQDEAKMVLFLVRYYLFKNSYRTEKKKKRTQITLKDIS